MEKYLPLLLVALGIFFINADAVGINYGNFADNLPSPDRVVNLIKSLPACVNVRHVKIFDANPSLLNAFKNSGFGMIVAAENISELNSPAAASKWLDDHKIDEFKNIITTIVVDNEPNGHGRLNSVVPAMRNLRDALKKRNLIFRVTTPIEYNFLSNSHPPSASVFTDSNSFRPLLEFLRQEKSVFMVNIYPFFDSYSGRAPLEYALFSDRVMVTDGNFGYTSLYDEIVDAIYVALEKAGYGDLEVVIGETGWPNAGAKYASPLNAQRYNSKVTERVNENLKTPRGKTAGAYIFALFNENQKPNTDVGTTEKHWGLLNADGTPVYKLC